MSAPNLASPQGEDLPIEPDALQFDQAEYAAPVPSGPICGACQRPIVDEYYEINGKVVCDSCREAIEASFRGGSRLGRALKALIFGSVAAAVGAVLYYAFVRLTNINFGWAAIILGLMVGGAVKKGSGNRGGRFYQLLAVFLTYSAIVAMHVPMLIAELRKATDERKPEATAPAKAEKPAEVNPARPKNDASAKHSADYTGVDIPDNPFADDPAAPAKVAAQAAAAPAPADEAPGPGMVVLAIALIFVAALAFSYAVPVLISIQAPISGLIYCFALWEAWKINKRVQLALNGPYQVKTTVTDDFEPEGDDDGG